MKHATAVFLFALAACNGEVTGDAGEAGAQPCGDGGTCSDAGPAGSEAEAGAMAGPCTTSADCPSGATCLFEIGAPCPGSGACFQDYDNGFDVCASETYLCGCDGRAFTISGCPEVAGMGVNLAPVPLTNSQNCPFDGG